MTPTRLAAETERLAELVPSLLASSDEEGRFTYVNQAWRELLGWEPDELVGRPGRDLTHPEDLGLIERALHGNGHGPETSIEVELRLLAKDGSWHWFDWRVRVEDGRRYASGQSCDERHRVDAKLEAGEARLTAAQRIAGIGSFEVDRESGALTWSDESYRLVGLEPGSAQITPERAIAFSHPDDSERVNAYWRHLFSEHAPVSAIEFRIQRTDGAERILYLQGSDVDGRVVGTLQDVTESRRARQALESSERRYRALMEQVPAIVYTAVPGEDGAFDLVSPHIERMLGYAAEEWTGNSAHWLAAIHPDDRSHVLAAQLHARNPGDKLLCEYRIFSSDGGLVHVRDAATVFENTRGEVRLQGVIVDVTESRQAELALAESEERYRSIVDTSQSLIYVLSAQNQVTFVNRAATEILGYEADEILGRPFTDFQTPEAVERDLEHAAKVLEGGHVFDVETQVVRKDGRVIDVCFNATLLRDTDGNAVGILGTARDLTADKHHARELSEKHDQLQSIIDNSPLVVFAKDRELRYLLANREFEDSMSVEPGWVIGKADGDFLPLEVARQLEFNDRRVLETGEALEVEETVRAHGEARTFLTYKFPLLGDEDAVYGVCGIAIDITDRKAREDGLRSKVEWSFRIRKAIADDRLVLHSQPIVDIASGETVQEELLLRMLSEDGGGLVMPGEFLPPAERFGLAPAIDRWVVARAVQLARHQRVEVNLSAKSLGERSLTTFVENLLEETGADPSNLVFEVTETAAAQDLTQARELAERLIALGCGFALDDFGTGYGSFTYLKHLPVSYIKIDMEFVRNLASNETDRRVVKAIVDVASNFDIKTIAEGVESQAVLELLQGLGVDYAQGYHLGKPSRVVETAA